MLPIGIKLVGMTRYLPMPLSRILLQVLTAGVGPSRPSTVVRFRGLAANKQPVTPQPSLVSCLPQAEREMFDWLWKRGTKVPAQETKTYKLGQNAAQGLVADLDSFMRTRFDSVFDGYLGVLRDCFERPSTVPRHRPSYSLESNTTASWRTLTSFAKMPPDITAALSGWRDLSDELGKREDFQRLIAVAAAPPANVTADTSTEDGLKTRLPNTENSVCS
jgi:hypothetical protein